MTIDTALAAFTEHCAKHSLEDRPTIWSQFIDIWGEHRGEIGLPDPPDLTRGVFALLTPWAMVPTMGTAWLVVDRLNELSVTRLHVNMRGMFDPHWTVPYKMDDEGRLEFGEPILDQWPAGVYLGVAAAKAARMRQSFWDSEHSFESILPMVTGLLGR